MVISFPVSMIYSSSLKAVFVLKIMVSLLLNGSEQDEINSSCASTLKSFVPSLIFVNEKVLSLIFSIFCGCGMSLSIWYLLGFL